MTLNMDKVDRILLTHLGLTSDDMSDFRWADYDNEVYAVVDALNYWVEYDGLDRHLARSISDDLLSNAYQYSASFYSFPEHDTELDYWHTSLEFAKANHVLCSELINEIRRYDADTNEGWDAIVGLIASFKEAVTDNYDEWMDITPGNNKEQFLDAAGQRFGLHRKALFYNVVAENGAYIYDNIDYICGLIDGHVDNISDLIDTMESEQVEFITTKR